MRDITLESTEYFDFTTRALSGVPTVLAGTPALSVLEENNATPITAGVSVSVDRASVVGLNTATVVATAANGYEAGKSYSIYISTGTVDGVSVVGEIVGQFTVGEMLKPTVAGRTLDVTATGAAGIDWGNVENPTTAVDLSGTDIQLCDTVTTLTGHTAQTGDTYALANGAAGFVAIDTVVDAIKVITDAIGATGTGLSAIPWNAAWDAEVQSECADALTAYGPNTTTPPTAAAIADAVLDEALSGHVTAGSLGKAVADIETDTNSLNDTKIPQTLNLTASGNIGIDWANVENPTTAVDLSGTDIQLCDTITTYTGNTVQTGDSFARLGAPAGASVSADIAVVDGVADAVKVTTDKFVFTVANQVDANIQSINDTTITGDGNSGTEFGV